MVDGLLAKGFYAGTALDQKKPGHITRGTMDRLELGMWTLFVLIIIICVTLTIFNVIK